MNKLIYVDNAATTQVDKRVVEEMLDYFTEDYGNPSSIHQIGRKAKDAVEKARRQIAKAINAGEKEIYFTSGGTEADNWALLNTAKNYKNKGKHIISTKIEHHAVLHALQELEKDGFEVTYLGVDDKGLISIDELKSAIRDDTILISVMFANNEIGTIQPISQIGETAREKGIIFHTDAVQALGNVKIDVESMKIDMLSIAAHKIYGPKGVGALYVRRGIKLKSFIVGGGQEKGKRASTENVPGIVGFAKAVELFASDEYIEENKSRLEKMRNRLIDGVLSAIPYSRLNGDKVNRLAGNANFSIEFIEGESLLLTLDMYGICASSGSACTSGSLDPSHVLLALGLSHEVAHGSLRITLGHNNTEDDIDYILKILPQAVKRLREMSPLWEGKEGYKNV